MPFALSSWWAGTTKRDYSGTTLNTGNHEVTNQQSAVVILELYRALGNSVKSSLSCLLSVTDAASKENGSSSPAPKIEPVKSGITDEFYPLNMSNTPNSLSPASRDESKGHPERKRRASDEDSCEVVFSNTLIWILNFRDVITVQ